MLKINMSSFRMSDVFEVLVYNYLPISHFGLALLEKEARKCLLINVHYKNTQLPSASSPLRSKTAISNASQIISLSVWSYSITVYCYLIRLDKEISMHVCANPIGDDLKV